MLVVTTENVPGHRVREVKGQVFGVVVRSRGIGGNIMAGLRSIVGGMNKSNCLALIVRLHRDADAFLDALARCRL